MRIALLPVAGAVVLLGLACAGPQPAPGPAGTGDGPKQGGIMNVRVSVDPIDYDPTFNGTTSPNDTGLAQAYNSLLGFKTGPDIGFTEMVVQPELAERWEVSPDARTFTFHLRKGVKYANLPPVNGRELTANDVKFSFEYYNRFGDFKDLPKAQHAGVMYEGIESVEIQDPYTVSVRFKEAFVPFLSYAASDWNAILPREVYLRDGHFKDAMVGTGPYQLDTSASQTGTRWSFKKNRDYFDAANAHVDEIRWLVIKEETTAFAAFQARQLDLFSGSLTYPAYQQLKTMSPGAQYPRYMQPQGYHLHFSQVLDSPLRDVRVRRALALSVDRDELNKTVAGGEGEWAVTAAMHGLFTQEEARRIMRQDVNEARRLLSEAGYPNGINLDWPVADDVSSVHLAWYQLLQAQMKRAGINVNLDVMDKNNQRAKRRRGDFHIDVVQALGLLQADADSMMFGIYHSKGATNWPKNNDPELDKLLEAQRREVDPARRREVQRQAAQRAVDQAWGVELIYPPVYNAAQSYVKGFHPHFSVYSDHTRAWLDK